jgi:hypothetical protein
MHVAFTAVRVRARVQLRHLLQLSSFMSLVEVSVADWQKSVVASCCTNRGYYMNTFIWLRMLKEMVGEIRECD